MFDWTRENGIRLIYDESFSDFALEEERSMLRDEVLEQYPELFIVKSLSKSYGIPGLRLGIAAGSDGKMIDRLKKDVAIWNINSFAEHFLQIFGKYESQYIASTRRLAEEREWFARALSGVKGLRVLPSQANYLTVELNREISATGLTEILLDKYEMLVKDLSGKVNAPYLRIAVRDRQDNEALVHALLCELGEGRNRS